jgi:hypothetical protein
VADAESTRVHQKDSDRRGYVKWWLIAWGILMIIAGVLSEFLISDRYKSLRDLVAGILATAGFGLIIGEMIARSERKAHEAQTEQLLEPARARARAAYRIPAYLAWIGGREIGDGFGWTFDLEAASRWKVPLNLNFAALGIDAVVEPILARQNLRVSTKFLHIKQAVDSAGEYAGAFYDLGSRIGFLADQETRPTDRAELRQEVSVIRDRLHAVAGYFDRTDVALAWRNFVTHWDSGLLRDVDVNVVLRTFDAYLLRLGLANASFEQWEVIIQRLARIRRPLWLAQLAGPTEPQLPWLAPLSAWLLGLRKKGLRDRLEKLLPDAQRAFVREITLGHPPTGEAPRHYHVPRMG